jgi:hypothetical protein
MMSNLIKAIQINNNITRTTNGMKAYKSSNNNVVDLFGKIGSSRGKNLTPDFYAAANEDMDLAMRVLQYARDIRGGMGERGAFRTILKDLAINDYQLTTRLLPKIPVIGRWDDVLVLLWTPAEQEAVELIREALEHGNSLCAKWMPRKGNMAVKLIQRLGWTPKFYRKTIVGLSNTVEQLMCAGKWNDIEYGKLPSVASARYQKAFGRRSPERYAAYIQALQKGEAKINAGAVYPYDVLKSVLFGNAAVADQQWKALPDYMPEGVNILPIIDVSSSMGCRVHGMAELDCMHMAISLGMYLAERNKGIFKDAFITFHNSPELRVMKSRTLSQRYREVKTSPWGGSTNLLSTFRLILDAAMSNRLSQEDLPTHLVILSDMQFNEADRTGDSAVEAAQRMFTQAGYRCPQLIFWNLNAMSDNTPVKVNDEGVALVSGFSPAIMKSVMSNKVVSPLEMVKDAVCIERYDW